MGGSSSIILYPKVEVLANAVMFALRPLPVCQSVQCAERTEAPASIGSLFKTGGVGWEFVWHPFQHGVAECVACGAWHQVYHWRDEEWEDAPVQGKLYRGGWGNSDHVGIESKRLPDRWLYVFAELIDDRREHAPQADREGAQV